MNRFIYEVSDKVRFKNGEEAVIIDISHIGAANYHITFDKAIIGAINFSTRSEAWCYDTHGKFITSLGAGNDIVELVQAAVTSMEVESPKLQTIADVLKELPSGTRVTDGVREWKVEDGVYGKYLNSRGTRDTDSVGSSMCMYLSIPNLRPVRNKVLKGRVLFEHKGRIRMTNNNYTEKEFLSGHLFIEDTFVRILTNVPEFPVTEVEE